MAHALTERCEEVSVALLGRPSSTSDRELRFGKHGSFALRRDGAKRGCWYDHERGEGGDMLKLLAREHGVRLGEAIRIAKRDYLGGVNALPRPQPALQQVDGSGTKEVASRIWREAIALAGTLGERYFGEYRRLDIRALDLDHVLRWHNKYRCIIALMTTPAEDKPSGIHRTFLNTDGSKRDRKMLGRAGVIRLSRDDAVKAVSVLPRALRTVWPCCWPAGHLFGLLGVRARSGDFRCSPASTHSRSLPTPTQRALRLRRNAQDVGPPLAKRCASRRPAKWTMNKPLIKDWNIAHSEGINAREVADAIKPHQLSTPHQQTFKHASAENLPSENEAAGSQNSHFAEPAWPVLHDAAYYGLAGEIVRTIEPHSEADSVAILLQFLAAFGNAVGTSPYYQVEGDKHCPKLFVVTSGATSKGRKGTALGRIRQLMEIADPDWERDNIQTGLSSGEGLIFHVRDPASKRGKVGMIEQVDAGVADKRLMLVTEEFAGALRVMERAGNTLSPVLRDAWGTSKLQTLTKNSPIKATDSHISIIGHVTDDELRAVLTKVEMANGFANRFLFARVKRSKFLHLNFATLQELGEQIAERLRQARTLGRVTMTDAAAEAWEKNYADLSRDRPGLLGAILGRAEAQVTRIALIYALLDNAERIDLSHSESSPGRLGVLRGQRDADLGRHDRR